MKGYAVRIEQPSLCGTTSFFFDALSKFKVHKRIRGNLLKKIKEQWLIERASAKH